MRAYEFLAEGNILLEYKDIENTRFKHGVIKHQTKPHTDGKFYGASFYEPKGEKPIRVHDEQVVSGNSAEDIFNKLKAMLDNVAREQYKKKNLSADNEKVDAAKVGGSAFDFNTAFTRIEMDNEQPTGYRLNNDGTLDIATQEAWESGVLNGEGFVKIKDRMFNRRAKTKIFGGPVSPKMIQHLGMEFHGVYSLERDQSPDPEMYTRYKLDQIGWSNKNTSYPIPAVTVAYWLKGSGKKVKQTQDVDDI